ncbi:hypothetical protein L596_017745 [Steinernema carpocapsae]|uniref:Uncharacterized protein n=1 Tax=Steinernema carpocapsae TaxID=34508 RepID=A0A4U5N3C8_STECR|nr:hypothetical protein L596_017745 [Steinernema carpocapsae]
MSTSEVLTPPSTSMVTSPGLRCRQRFHSEGENPEHESRRKRAIRKKRLGPNDPLHLNPNVSKSSRRRQKR